MQNRNYFYITVAVIVLIVALAAFIIANYDFSQYKYSVSRKGVDFVSNSAPPSEILGEMRATETFIVAPQFVEKGPENSYMASAMTLYATVLTAKGKKVIIVGRLLDEQGQLKECQSNFGDVKINKTISAEECGALLNDSGSARIFISLPDSKLSAPKIVMEKGSAFIYPDSFESVSGSSFVFLENLYDDSEAIISGVNSVVERL